MARRPAADAAPRLWLAKAAWGVALAAASCSGGSSSAPGPLPDATGAGSGGAAAASAGASGGSAGGAGPGGLAGAAGAPLAGIGGSAGGAAGASAGQGGAPLADVCPLGPSPGLPAASPRILIVGPSIAGVDQMATHLQGLLAADPSFSAPEVIAQPSNTTSSASLMSFWYAPTDRDARLASLKGPFTWVVLLEDPSVALGYPEIYFEGARVLACQVRATGANPILLMPWSSVSDETATTGEMTYRVGNGTGTPVVPAGYAWDGGSHVVGSAGGGGGAGSQGGSAGSGGQGGSAGSSGNGGQGGAPPQIPAGPNHRAVFTAAASLYSAITGKSAAGTTYQPGAITAAEQSAFSAAAADAVASHAAMTHYQAPFVSAVKLQTTTAQGDFVFMDSGTSSEALWHDRMNEILPRLGFTPKGAAIGVCNDIKSFDAACLDKAAASFASAQYQILFARSYSIAAPAITAAGKQTELVAQVWDRHYDGIPADGAAAVEALDERSRFGISMARQFGLAWTPYHLTFAKLKTARPSINLTSDGTHATYPVGYALAALSLISRTSLQVPTDGLDPDTAAGVRLADETIRQLAWLSQWSVYVADDPATRPSVQ